jgi:outer membrane protein
MNTLCRKLLIALILCALPAMAVAAETITGKDQQPSDQAAPQTPPATTQKAAEAAAPQPVQQPAAQPAIRIGYVDLLRVSTDSEPGKAGQAKLIEKKNKFQVQIETKRKQLDKQRAAIEAKLSSLSPQQREAKGKEFGKKVEEFQKFGQNAENQLQEMQQELIRTLYGKIEQAAGDYGKAKGFAAIIARRDLLYAASGVDVRDVTDDVVKLINEKDAKK